MGYLELLEKRRKIVAGKVDTATTVEELKLLQEELRSMDDEINELKTAQLAEAAALEARGIASMPLNTTTNTAAPEDRGGLNPIATYAQGQQVPAVDARAALTKTYEERGQALKDKRAVTFSLNELPEFRATSLGGGTLVNVTHESNTLNETFNQVSGLIDKVNSIPLSGGESYKKGFEVSIAEGNYTTEEGNYTETEAAYDYVDITKAKITSYAEISDEAVKLPNIGYQSYVAKSVGESLRKKVTKQILVGAGGANAITGIFNAPVKVIPISSDILISTIDANTLDKIVFGFGGDEDVEGGAVLILNKNDLAAFAAIRSTTGERLYKIEKNGNQGTISSDDSFKVPFVINSAAPALSAVGTTVNTYCMAYGMVKAYELPIFSDVTVEESRDFKFKSGQIAYRASAWMGGNTAMYRGFCKVKKVAAV